VLCDKHEGFKWSLELYVDLSHRGLFPPLDSTFGIEFWNVIEFSEELSDFPVADMFAGVGDGDGVEVPKDHLKDILLFGGQFEKAIAESVDRHLVMVGVSEADRRL
jgi:hypothetical protein